MTPEPVSESVSPNELVDFWRDAGPERWFRKDEAFDRHFRDRFLPVHERARRGELDDWMSEPFSALALVLLLDQFPRNSFRETPRMFATDELGRHHAGRAIEAGYDRSVDEQLQFFFYLPFGHSETLLDQEKNVALCQRFSGSEFGKEVVRHAREHRDIVRRFGRFPHRNRILDRPSSAAELAFLEQGGFQG